MARPTKYDAKKAETICSRLRAGSTRKAAAESVGISYDCFLDWFQKGEKLTEETTRGAEFFQFFQAVCRSEAELEIQCAAMVSKAAFGSKSTSTRSGERSLVKMKRTKHPDGTVVEEPVVVSLTVSETTTTEGFDWRAALEILKRRRREEWGDAIKQEVSGPGGKPIEVNSAALEKAAKELTDWRTQMSEQLVVPSQPPA